MLEFEICARTTCKHMFKMLSISLQHFFFVFEISNSLEQIHIDRAESKL